MANPFGLTVEHIGAPVRPGLRAPTAVRAWRGRRLLGRVVNHTSYPPSGSAGPTSYEAQQWEADTFQEGPRFSELFDALEFLT